MATNFIIQPNSGFRLGDYLKQHFNQDEWKEFRAAVAFVKNSGVRHVSQELCDFSQRASVKISVGIDMGGSSVEGLTNLVDCLSGRGELWVYHNENRNTFHPKVYLFKNENRADVVVGSGNLTEGGLYTNYEASIAVSLNLLNTEDRVVFESIETVLDSWMNTTDGATRILNQETIEELVDQGYITTEERTRETEEAGVEPPREAAERSDSRSTLFSRVGVTRAPVIPHRAAVDRVREPNGGNIGRSQEHPTMPEGQQVFLMTLQQTDVGVGQTNQGTARRSPEIFIPLAARNYSPEFWGWPDLFEEDNGWQGSTDGDGRGKMDRNGVSMRLNEEPIVVNMFYNPNKRDLRLRSEALRSAGTIGDILSIERTNGEDEIEYNVSIINQNSSEYNEYLELCNQPVRNSQKVWGYYYL